MLNNIKYSYTCIGSTMTPVTGHPFLSPATMASSAIARHRSSSALFSLNHFHTTES